MPSKNMLIGIVLASVLVSGAIGILIGRTLLKGTDGAGTKTAAEFEKHNDIYLSVLDRVDAQDFRMGFAEIEDHTSKIVETGDNIIFPHAKLRTRVPEEIFTKIEEDYGKWQLEDRPIEYTYEIDLVNESHENGDVGRANNVGPIGVNSDGFAWLDQTGATNSISSLNTCVLRVTLEHATYEIFATWYVTEIASKAKGDEPIDYVSYRPKEAAIHWLGPFRVPKK